MTDEDIAKLAFKLGVTLATKDDINLLKGDINRLEGKIDDLDNKANTILEFTEVVDETTTDHEKRLKKIEAIPAIAHQIKK